MEQANPENDTERHAIEDVRNHHSCDIQSARTRSPILLEATEFSAQPAVLAEPD